MKKNPEVFLQHILESINEIERYVAEIDRDDFLEETQVQDAVIRRLEIIGEAAKNLPKSFMAENIDIPWKKLAGLRDVLIHAYFGVDKELVWKIIEKDIPKLKKQISKLI